MIKLTKLSEPSILTKYKEEWTNEYLDALSGKKSLTTTIRYRYRHREIKDTLILETHGKCAYCESKILHISYGDVEHILPKSKYPELYVDWNNLTLCCEICNGTRKNDYYNNENPLLNPYVDEPSEHLLAVGPILKDNNSSKGSISIKILGLNRTALLERRTERLDDIILLVKLYNSITDLSLKQLIKNQLLEEFKDDKEFSFVVKSYLSNELNF